MHLRSVVSVILLTLAAGGNCAGATAPVLAVLKFQDESGAMPLQGGAGRALSNMLATELAARGAFTVVERRKLAAILEEQDLARSGLLKPGEGARIGQLTGAQYLVMGTVTAFEDNAHTQVSGGGMFSRARVESVSDGAYLAVDLRVVDASSGEVAFARTIEGRTEGSRTDLTDQHAGLAMMNKPSESRAVRAAVIEIIDYLECAMIKRDGCMSQFAESERKRLDSTRRALKDDGGKQ